MRTAPEGLGFQPFVEFGPGGSERIEIAPRDFALIPKGVVHREGNAGADENDGTGVRVGQGAVLATNRCREHRLEAALLTLAGYRRGGDRRRLSCLFVE